MGVIFAIIVEMAQLPENIARYEQLTHTGTEDPLPYDRLMIYYRKQKEYKKELQVINRALKIFGEQLKRQSNRIVAAARSRLSVKRLSEKLGKSVGLMDKKGNVSYVPEPLARWMKRKQTVQNKIKK
jgi:hypothetical protein